MLDRYDLTPLHLAEAARLCPGEPHYSALWRWCRKGIKLRRDACIRLAHFRAGGRIYTTQADVWRFLDAVADADATHFAMPRSQS